MSKGIVSQFRHELKNMKYELGDLYEAFRPYIKYVLLGLLVYMIINPDKIQGLILKIKEWLVALYVKFIAWFNRMIGQIGAKLGNIGGTMQEASSLTNFNLQTNAQPNLNVNQPDEENDLFEFNV